MYAKYVEKQISWKFIILNLMQDILSSEQQSVTGSPCVRSAIRKYIESVKHNARMDKDSQGFIGQ